MSAAATAALAPDFVDRLVRAADTPAGGAVPPDAEERVDELLGIRGQRSARRRVRRTEQSVCKVRRQYGRGCGAHRAPTARSASRTAAS